ncbi:MAG: hypothetical protein ACYC0V_07235 [Armatimonadota bacterium]
MSVPEEDGKTGKEKWWFRLLDASSNSIMEEILVYAVEIFLLLGGGTIVYILFFR